MWKFLRSLIGGIGLIDYDKKCPFVSDDFLNAEEFYKQLKPGDIIFSRRHKKAKLKPGFLDRGIQAATDFQWPHVFLYVGGEWASRARDFFPEFFEPKELIFSKSKNEFNIYSPPDACKHEIIDAQEILTTRDINSYFENQEQLAVWRRPLEDLEILSIFKNAYSTLGSLYDVLEIGKHLFFFLPNSKKKYVCSTDVVAAYEQVEKIINPSNPDISMQSPRDMWEYFDSHPHWKLCVKIGWR